MAEPHPQVVDPAHPLVAWVRFVCLRYPESAEVEAWGRPTFRAGKKIFVLVGASMDDSLTIVFKPGSADERLSYLERPGFYSPPYWGPGGWLAAPRRRGLARGARRDHRHLVPAGGARAAGARPRRPRSVTKFRMSGHPSSIYLWSALQPEFRALPRPVLGGVNGWYSFQVGFESYVRSSTPMRP